MFSEKNKIFIQESLRHRFYVINILIELKVTLFEWLCLAFVKALSTKPITANATYVFVKRILAAVNI